MLIRLLTLALVLCTAGCELFNSKSQIQTIRSAGTDAREAQLSTVRRISDLLAQRVRVRRDAGLDILLLSGGGQHGAYGTGFLRGWQNRTQPAMPQFDLVTAVSSGALQAPFALVGTQEALARGSTLYRNQAIELAPTRDLWSGAELGSEGDGGRYWALVESVLDRSLQKQLVKEFGDKRSIAIATTDFDLGAQRIWELGHELDDSDRGLRRARALLFASAAVPGAMRPIMIDNHVHASGDVASNLLVPLEFDDFRVLAARLKALGISDTIQIRIWVILNGFGAAPEERLEPEDAVSLDGRSHTLAYYSKQAQELDRLADLARAVDGGIRGLHVQVHITMIPADLAEDPGAYDPYNEQWMLRLEQVGYERARSESAWDRVVIPRGRYD